MPQRSKGDRDHVTVRPPTELGVLAVAERAGYSASQYVSDLLAIALGHPELVAGPDRKKTGANAALPGMPSEQELRAIREQLASGERPKSDQEVITAA